MNSPQVTRESKHYLAKLVSERVGFIYPVIEWYRVEDKGKSGKLLAPDPHDPHGHKRKTFVNSMYAFRDQYISVLGPPVFENKPEKFKNAINATDPPTSYYYREKKESEQGGGLKARDENVNLFFNMKHPLLYDVNSDESFTESEYDEIGLKIKQIDRKTALCIEHNCPKIPGVFRRELEGFGNVQSATLEAEGQQEMEDRSIPMSANSPTKDDPRRWLIQLPKDELKALLEKRISEGENIKSSFEPRPLPSEMTIEGPKFSRRPPIPPLPKQRASRSGMQKAPEIGAKPEPKFWQFMGLSSVSAWQAEFSPWDNLNFTILQRGYCSREAYRDYLPNLKVSRVRLYPATKKLGLGDIMTEWLNSFIQAYNEKITQLKRYLHELEYYEFEADIGIPQGEKYHPAGTPEKSLAPGQLPDKKEVDEIDEMAESSKEHPEAENVFNEDKIKFKGRLISGLSWTQGFDFMRMCLAKPGEDIPVIEMIEKWEGGKRYSKKIYDDKDNVKIRAESIRRELKKLSVKRGLPENKDNSTAQNLIDAECKRLENELDSLFYKSGQPKPEYDIVESYRKRVYKAVECAREKLRAENVELFNHLKQHIITGRFCKYDGDLQWET